MTGASFGEPSFEKPALSKQAFTVRAVAATSAGLFAVGVVLLRLRGVSAASLFDSAYTPAVGATLGAALGGTMAAGQLVLLRFWDPWRAYTLRAVVPLDLDSWQIAAIALMVGIAEELSYRAALQPLAGLWATSALFTLVHVRLSRSAWGGLDRPYAIAAVGLLFAVSLALGVLFLRVGLLAAMVAHFVYDLVVLHAYMAMRRRHVGAALEGLPGSP